MDFGGLRICGIQFKNFEGDVLKLECGDVCMTLSNQEQLGLFLGGNYLFSFSNPPPYSFSHFSLFSLVNLPSTLVTNFDVLHPSLLVINISLLSYLKL